MVVGPVAGERFPTKISESGGEEGEEEGMVVGKVEGEGEEGGGEKGEGEEKDWAVEGEELMGATDR